MVLKSIWRSAFVAVAMWSLGIPALAQDVSLSVSENPCFIADGESFCDTTISWETPFEPGRIAIRIVNHNTSRVWRCPHRGPGSFVFSQSAETPKTIEAHLVDEGDCTHPDLAAEDAFFDPLEPQARLPIFGVKRKIFAEPQQCILRPGQSKCDIDLRWSPGLLPPGRDRVQVRFTSATISGAPVATWRCFDPATGPTGDTFPFATRNGKIIDLLATTGCDREDLDVDLIDRVRVRGIPEMNGVYFTPNLLPVALDDPPPSPGESFTLRGSSALYRAAGWYEAVLDDDPVIQTAIDFQMREYLASIANAGAGFNLIFVPAREWVPWPDTENGESVADIAGEIRHAVDKMVHVAELASGEGLMSAFTFHHFCQIPNSVAAGPDGMPFDPNWEHQGGTCRPLTCPPQGPGDCDRFPVCGDDNIEVTLEWYELIFDHFEAELEARDLFNDVAYVNPVSRFHPNDGGDPATTWVEDPVPGKGNPYIEDTQEYLREIAPRLQQMTDIPISAGMSIMSWRQVEEERYEPIEDYWAVVPHGLADFLYVTTVFESEKADHGPVTLDPALVLEAFGGPAAKLSLTDWNLELMAEADACANLDDPDPVRCDAARDFVICRAGCNAEFHRGAVPLPGVTGVGGSGTGAFGLAGTWVLGYRAAFSERHAAAPPTSGRHRRFLQNRPKIGLRERNCLQIGGNCTGTIDCTFNDSLDWTILDQIINPSCPAAGVCIEP